MITKTIFAGFLIMILSLSAVAYPLAASAQNPNEQSNGKPQIVSAMGKIPGKDIAVHMWVLIQHGADKDEVVRQALAKHGAQQFVSEKFTTNGLYWNQFGDTSLDNDFVTQNYNPQNDPSSGGGLVALQNTHTTWNNVDSSSFVFDYGSETTRCPSLVDECPGGQTFDGYNDVAWVALAGNNVLGVTWYGLGTDEADMALNTSFPWATDGTNHYDIETVMLHENGHVLGLSHSNDSQAGMYASYHGVLRSLHSDDIAGISSLYPQIDPPTLTGITISPLGSSVDEGATLQYTATGHYGVGGDADITNDVAWSSDDEGIATIDSSGLATGVSPGGPVTITATLDAFNPSTSLTVDALPDPPTDPPTDPPASQEPSISISNPLDGSIVNGKMTITASVTGITNPIVSFYLNGEEIDVDSNAPYEYGIHTKNWQSDFYEIMVSVVTDESEELNDIVTVEKEPKGGGDSGSGGPGEKCPPGKQAKGKC